MNQYKSGNSDRPFWIEAYGGRRYTVDRELQGASGCPPADGLACGGRFNPSR